MSPSVSSDASSSSANAPSDAKPGDATALLMAARDGDPDARDALFTCVYAQLRRLARKVRQGSASETLNTTALVHEAYLKLVRPEDVHWQSRLHFYRVAAQAMRQVLVNAAEAHARLKRGGGAPHTSFDEALHGDAGAPAVAPEDVLALNDALMRLATLDARQAQVVECRFFAGLSVKETAAVLDLSPSTVKRDWRAARAFLAATLGSSPLD
jgi:RNA polymerase sigma factor (TIGR02999 family)